MYSIRKQAVSLIAANDLSSKVLWCRAMLNCHVNRLSPGSGAKSRGGFREGLSAGRSSYLTDSEKFLRAVVSIEVVSRPGSVMRSVRKMMFR